MRRWCLLALALLACSPRNEIPYGACASSAVCAEDTPLCINFRNRVNGQNIPLCTTPCQSSAECPDRGVCVNTETAGLGSLCVKRCAVADDCGFTPAICPVVRDGERGCVP